MYSIVIEVWMAMINSILAKAVKHRQFKELLVENESEYNDFLLHNKVHWF